MPRCQKPKGWNQMRKTLPSPFRAKSFNMIIEFLYEKFYYCLLLVKIKKQMESVPVPVPVKVIIMWFACDVGKKKL
mgnify:CR=1 FL=1